MKVFTIIIGFVNGVLLLTTLICGLWIKLSAGSSAVLEGITAFHTVIGIAATVVGMATSLFIIVVAMLKMK